MTELEYLRERLEAAQRANDRLEQSLKDERARGFAQWREQMQRAVTLQVALQAAEHSLVTWQKFGPASAPHAVEVTAQRIREALARLGVPTYSEEEKEPVA